MYTEADYRHIRGQVMARGAVFILILLAVVAAQAVSAYFRLRALAYIGAVLGAWLAYAFLMLGFMPYHRYSKHLSDIRRGLSRETEALFISLAERPRMADGILVYDLMARVGDKEEDARLFLWDAEKPLPSLTVDQPVRINSYGNFVLELEASK